MGTSGRLPLTPMDTHEVDMAEPISFCSAHRTVVPDCPACNCEVPDGWHAEMEAWEAEQIHITCERCNFVFFNSEICPGCNYPAP